MARLNVLSQFDIALRTDDKQPAVAQTGKASGVNQSTRKYAVAPLSAVKATSPKSSNCGYAPL